MVERENLVWIRHDLGQAKSFGVEDCYPVGEGDKWDGSPSELSFAEALWGEGKRRSFVQVVQASMVGRGRGMA